MKRKLFNLVTLFTLILMVGTARGETVSVLLAPVAAPRVEFGAARLTDAVKAAGLTVVIEGKSSLDKPQHRIIVGDRQLPAIKRLIDSGMLKLQSNELGPEGFVIASWGDALLAVVGADDSGTLYGCLELAKRITDGKRLPADLRFADAPQFKLRGPCIGMQKTFILPGRHVYEYPYTPDLFPFFYDKAFWQQYLDFLVENRMNTLYLWNGHPFASLVKLKDYPYAMEVPEDVFQKNVEMFRYVASEANKRGIWLVQMFYSIIVSKPFAEHEGTSTQLAAPTPAASDYTRKSIAEFVHQYPNVGLMVCLGEALQGLDNQVQWCTNVILPGIKDGMAAAGLTNEPPVVVRTHATDARVVMPAALKIYKNLYTEAKFNGESLTTWEPRGTRQDLQLEMSRLGSTHVANIHILANLEPFRYGAQRFIKLCTQAARDRLGARGIHLYPLSYWNWPDAPDLTDVPLKQYQRDWIWFEAWARYAWNPDIPEAEDHAYWIGRLAGMYGNEQAAEKILAAYNDSGECAPRILRRYGITEGNRQTMSLGMTLDELVNPGRYQAFPELWESQSPPGERLQEYVDNDWKKRPHVGETPPQINHEVLDFSHKAVESIDAAAPLVTRNQDEFARLRNDVHCIRAMSECYAAKTEAARLVLRYNYSRDIADMDHAQAQLEKSFVAYQHLAALTEKTYRYANSMQTSQRKIPVSGGAHGVGTNYHWVQLVGLYQKELTDFQARVARLRQNATPTTALDESDVKPWPAAAFKLISKNVETYAVQPGAHVYTDRDFAINQLAPELGGLTGIRFSHDAAKKGKVGPIEFEASEPVKVLVGYINSPQSAWLQVPRLETAAQADERGGIEPVILNAAAIDGLPGVNVHAFNYGPGRQKLELIGTGSFIVLGVVPQSVKMTPRDARRGGAL